MTKVCLLFALTRNKSWRERQAMNSRELIHLNISDGKAGT